MVVRLGDGGWGEEQHQWLGLYVYNQNVRMAQPICIQAQNVRTCASLADLHAHYMFILVSFYLDGYATGPFCHIHDGSLLEKALGPETIEVSGAAHW